MQVNYATFSKCKSYRYDLHRDLGMQGPCLTVVMLNPSTADATKDDPTIRRLIAFAGSWGHGSLHVFNLFAICASDPKVMLAADEPIGPDNDEHLKRALSAAKNEGRFVLAAWGTHGGYRSRDFQVMNRLVDGVQWKCLGRTHHGWPKHPLYVRSNVAPRDYP